MTIIILDEHRAMTPIASFTLYRDFKGKYQLCVTHADPEEMQKYDCVEARFEALGLACMDGAAWLRRQARDWRRRKKMKEAES